MQVTRKVLIVLIVSLAMAGSVALAAPAGAATPSPAGRIATTLQHRDGSITVTGYAFDRHDSGRSVTACLAVAGRCVSTVYANLPSTRFNRYRGISGRHAFVAHVRPVRPGVTLELLGGPGYRTWVNAKHVLTPGDRVVNLARRFVGTTRYVYGGASPRTGFDCSGYALYTYLHAQVASLPHSAEAQRHARFMRRIARAAARPGDLVFYVSGGAAYHVAIYGGNGTQYSASDPRDGIRHQRIWSSNIEFRTDWH